MFARHSSTASPRVCRGKIDDHRPEGCCSKSLGGSQWRGESEAAGDGAPSCTWIFFSLVWGEALEAPKKLHITVPKTATKMTKNSFTWMVMHFHFNEVDRFRTDNWIEHRRFPKI